ncbi:MAG: ammonia-forming cytochrome c nitrite reductase subunit c552 [Bacteroidota bacterium]|nr:ammonia-forming cytochrome c nitrite reductase subunit c552 [Bacteroidota bacterium]
MEEYYDEIEFKDWTHAVSKAPMLKDQHPGYEVYMTGIHATRGVSCAGTCRGKICMGSWCN